MARAILLPLQVLQLFTAFATGFDFLVSRPNGSGLCVSNERKYGYKDVIPIHDLRSSSIPEDRVTKWSDAWATTNINVTTYKTDQITHDEMTVTTDGSNQFKPLTSHDSGLFFIMTQAVNVSFLLTESNQSDKGVKVHLDHRDSESKQRISWAEFCKKLGTPDEKCDQLTVLQNKTEGDLVLAEGRQWTRLEFKFMNGTFELSANRELIYEWSVQDLSGGIIFPTILSGKTHSLPGVFKVPLRVVAGPSDIARPRNSLVRRFSSSGRLCVEIQWGWRSGVNMDQLGRYQLVNSSGHEFQQGKLDAVYRRTMLGFYLGDRGNFQLKLIDLSLEIYHVHLTQDCTAVMSIVGPAAGCAVYEVDFAKTAPERIFATKLNQSVRVNLSKEQFEQVCAVVNATHMEEVRFCGRWGCGIHNCTVEVSSYSS